MTDFNRFRFTFIDKLEDNFVHFPAFWISCMQMIRDKTGSFAFLFTASSFFFADILQKSTENHQSSLLLIFSQSPLLSNYHPRRSWERQKVTSPWCAKLPVNRGPMSCGQTPSVIGQKEDPKQTRETWRSTTYKSMTEESIFVRLKIWWVSEQP